MVRAKGCISDRWGIKDASDSAFGTRPRNARRSADRSRASVWSQAGIGGTIGDDLDIDRNARLLVDKHGKDASSFAVRRADALWAAGDLEGASTWLRIKSAVEQLSVPQPETPKKR